MCRCLLFRTPRASNYLASLSHGLQNIILSLTNSIRPPSHPSPLCLPSGEKRHANSLLFCGCLLGIINSCFGKYAFLKRHFLSARAVCTFSCLSKYTWWPQRGLSSTHTHTEWFDIFSSAFRRAPFRKTVNRHGRWKREWIRPDI